MDYPAQYDFSPTPLSDMSAEEMAAALEQFTGAARQSIGGSAAETLVLSAGVIVPTLGTVKVDTEASAAADDLTHIQTTNMRDGMEILLWAENAGHVVTVKDGAGGLGQIITTDGEDFVLDTAAKCLRLQRRGAAWLEVSRTSEASDLTAITAQVAVLTFLSRQLFGGDTDGVILYAATGLGSLQCLATSPASMTVTVSAGAGFLDSVPFVVAAAATSAAMTAPLSNPRYDSIFINTVTGAVAIETGDEAADPTPPAVAPDDCLLVANIFHRVGSVSIKDADDATNSYIVDARSKMNG